MNRLRRGALLLLLPLGCSSAGPARDPMGAIADFEPGESLKASSLLGCERMFDRYCDALFAPGAMGNLRLGSGEGSFSIYRGRTANGFSATYYFYARAKLRQQSTLPPDFRTVLARERYFEALSEFLRRKPRPDMTLGERARDLRTQRYLEALWDSAVDETVLRRMERAQPGFHRLREGFIPLELQVRRRELRRGLISEISLALWKNHRNWERVTRSFETMRSRLLEVVDGLELDEAVRERWRARLSTVRLFVPGEITELSDEECSTTGTNAYYYPRLNALTVCAGDFNSEDIYQTLAHELAHSLDFDSEAHAFRQGSRIGRGMRGLLDGGASCADWEGLKKGFDSMLEDWSGFSPDLPGLQRCLKSKAGPEGPIDPAVVEELARDEISVRLSELADENVFVKLTQKRLPLPDGSWKANPSYLDPRRFLRPGATADPTDDQESLLAFFVSEYRCSTEPGPVRMRAALSVARTLSTRLLAARLAMEGEFSSFPGLVRRGLASSPSERFADLLGSHALARSLVKHDRLWERRKAYLASTAWQCSRPSLTKSFPEEARIERELLFDVHTGGKERVRESLSAPIRAALGCSKDFAFNECSLPLKKTP